MTTNGYDRKFKNRVRKLLTNKIGEISKARSKKQKQVIDCLTRKRAVISKPPQTITVVDDEYSTEVSTKDVDEIFNKKLKSEKRKKRPSEDSCETTKKQKVHKKKQKVEKEETPQSDHILKKEKARSKRLRQNVSKSEKLLIFPTDNLHLTENTDRDNAYMNDNLTNRNRYAINDSLTILERRKRFGDPTVINGVPLNMSNLSIFNSSVTYVSTDFTASNSRDDFGCSFFSDAEDSNLSTNLINSNSKPTIMENATMDTESIDGGVNEDIDDVANLFVNTAVDIKEYDSDVSLVSSGDKSHPNSSSTPSKNDFRAELPFQDSEITLETPSKIKPKFYSLQNKVIAIMSPSCKFYFNGKLRVKVLIGKVEIYGFVFSKSETVVPAEIYSPRGVSLVSIETVCDKINANTSTESICNLLRTEGINIDIAENLAKKLNDFPGGQAVVVLENLENTLTKFLDTYYQFKLFPKVEDTTNYHNLHPRKAEKLLQAVFQYDNLQGKQLQKDSYRDSNVLKRLVNQNPNDYQRILIAGGKSVGKSTTLRYFINGLLPTRKEIVVVDFDPGQPEFTPSGCISLSLIDRPLIGPNYTHLKTPFYQLFIGEVDVTRCIPRYVNAAKKLVEYLNESTRLQNSTVVINTMGFCTGVGWDIIVYIIKLIHPSTVVQIGSHRPQNNFLRPLSSKVINEQIPILSPDRLAGREDEYSLWDKACDHDLHVVPTLAESKGKFGDLWEIGPRQQRDLTLLSYLSKILKYDELGEKFLFTQSLRINDAVPYSVPLSGLTISLMRPVVPASHILATMNGNIVALCGIDETQENSEEARAAEEVYPKTLPRAPLSTCYGFGIVRGVDVKTGKAYVNTPLSISELQSVNAFVGCIPLPVKLIGGLGHRNAPYVSEGVNLPTSRDTNRRFFRMRRHYVHRY
ncbi:polynucleotide 5'-hydroxyl-kinase NOL9 [Neodiprion virginianus]|uniref:polynucleotide 5'-hydroxyl-kinase NOL9 n=1 Tax=Neodiprion virginianus TaxID=2961670 RepID=UPI001EE6AE84|nr:polynucleotide 5'-hydroxyl-kinase NOL9 [Neodiprion virginianus]XP_046618282.1 polynucleotide 5'-hydroxyl-kinase NOL9 [Neodiprion virginianus]